MSHPSWQAQIKGEKLWILEPPRECYYTCSRLEVVVHPGEISELIFISECIFVDECNLINHCNLITMVTYF